jgi:hypothetical protein
MNAYLGLNLRSPATWIRAQSRSARPATLNAGPRCDDIGAFRREGGPLVGSCNETTPRDVSRVMAKTRGAAAVALALVGAFALGGCSRTEPAPVTSGAPPPSTPVPSAPSVAPSSVPSAPPSPAPTSGGSGEARYSCDDESTPFSLSLFDAPATAELEAHPTAERLRAAIAQGEFTISSFPGSGYWLVSRSATKAEYVARAIGGDPPLVYAAFVVREGAWAMWAYGQCRPTIALDGLSLATWTLDLALPKPNSEATSFTALVNERACTGGKPIAGRLVPPSITYGPEAITVVFAARPLAGDGFDCPGNPSMRVVVELQEPLGDRRLLDGAFFPPADPSAPAF